MPTMHQGELAIDEAGVHRLLTAQFPAWADLPLVRVPSAGTDNAIFRLGDDLAVRLPRIDWAVGQVEKDRVWLPRLAPHLQVAVPEPLGLGAPGEGYPWPWLVCRWLEGEDATTAPVGDRQQLATDLGRFVAALHAVDTAGGPTPSDAGARGVPLAVRDDDTREAIAALGDRVDAHAVAAAWDAALRAPVWDAPGVWIHGDLIAGNLLITDGRLSAVIDFGPLTVGDPAADVAAAWAFLTAENREAFRAAVLVDDATWARGRGWALSTALVALPYYWTTNPVLADISRRSIAEVLADQTASPGG